MLTLEHGKMKMMRLGNGSVALIFPLGPLNINIYGKIQRLHSIMLCSPRYLAEAHQGASVPLGRRRSGGISPQGHQHNSATL